MMSLPAHADKVHAQGQAAIAAVHVEAFDVQGEPHQGDVLPLHDLQVQAARADVSASLIDEVPETLQHLLPDGALDQAQLKHGGRGKGKSWRR